MVHLQSQQSKETIWVSFSKLVEVRWMEFDNGFRNGVGGSEVVVVRGEELALLGHPQDHPNPMGLQPTLIFILNSLQL